MAGHGINPGNAAWRPGKTPCVVQGRINKNRRIRTAICNEINLLKITQTLIVDIGFPASQGKQKKHNKKKRKMSRLKPEPGRSKVIHNKQVLMCTLVNKRSVRF